VVHPNIATGNLNVLFRDGLFHGLSHHDGGISAKGASILSRIIRGLFYNNYYASSGGSLYRYYLTHTASFLYAKFVDVYG